MKMKVKRDEKIECACGCGQLRCKYDIQGRERKYIWGHKNMFKKGHEGGFQKGNKIWNNQNSKKTQFKKGVKQSEEFIKKRFDNRRKMGWFKNRELTIKRLRKSKLEEKNPMHGKKGNLHNRYGEHHTEEVRKVIKEKRANQILPFTSSQEIKIQNFLKTLGIEFFTHQYMKQIKHSYQCDILIPSMNLIIECDGDFIHCNPTKYPPNFVRYPSEKKIITAKEIWERDRLRTKELIQKGFEVLRLWEFEINEMSIKEFENRLGSIK